MCGAQAELGRSVAKVMKAEDAMEACLTCMSCMDLLVDPATCTPCAEIAVGLVSRRGVPMTAGTFHP